MDDKIRCGWAEGQFEEYIKYHDEEWGVPVHEENTHFEFLILEGAQAGLSWATILKKREGYRKAFSNFDPNLVATYDRKKTELLYHNSEIVRNKLKINATINNAQKFLQVQEEFNGFDNYIWRFVDGEPIVNNWKSHKECPATTSQSDALSKDLKKRGFKFVGGTIMYAYMQACGLVDDHTVDCFKRTS